MLVVLLLVVWNTGGTSRFYLLTTIGLSQSYTSGKAIYCVRNRNAMRFFLENPWSPRQGEPRRVGNGGLIRSYKVLRNAQHGLALPNTTLYIHNRFGVLDYRAKHRDLRASPIVWREFVIPACPIQPCRSPFHRYAFVCKEWGFDQGLNERRGNINVMAMAMILSCSSRARK